MLTVDAKSRVSPERHGRPHYERHADWPLRMIESLDGRLIVEKTEQKYEFKTDTKVGKVG